MQVSMWRTSCALLSSVSLIVSGRSFAQDRFATSVVSYVQGTGSGIFVPTNALGGPRGAGLGSGSGDVCTLGVGGALTLGFDVTITDGPGSDFTVFENGFLFAGQPFSEVAYVEVSTNGVDFARFPSSYVGPPNGLSGFTAPWGTYSGMTGFTPVLANVSTNAIDPFDPVVSGGEGFDLARLTGDPLVVAGVVDVSQIHFVRIVDVPHQSGLDSAGHVVYDNSGATGTADIDAVAVTQHLGLVNALQPTVDLFVDSQGHLNLRLEDPNGFLDLDQSQLLVSFNAIPTSATRLRGLLPVLTTTPNGIVLRSLQPIVGSGRYGVLSVSVKDFAGNFSADQIVLQG